MRFDEKVKGLLGIIFGHGLPGFMQSLRNIGLGRLVEVIENNSSFINPAALMTGFGKTSSSAT